MLRPLAFSTALCAGVFFTQIPALAQTAASVTPLTPTQTLSPGSTATLLVRVLDASGVGVPSQLVSFSTSAAGAVFLNTSAQYTDQNGYAQALLVVPSTAGVYVVYAYAGTLSPATFVLYVGTEPTPTGGGGTGMQVSSGNGQVVSFMAPTTPRPLTVVVTDSSGARVSGVAVTWQVISGVAGLLQSACVTDSNGECGVAVTGNMTPTPNIPFQQATIMASSSYGTVNFVLTVLGMTGDQQPLGYLAQLLAPTTDAPLVGKSGQTSKDAIRVLVMTSTSIPIPNVGLDVLGNQDPNVGPVAYCVNTNALTDPSGYAKCDLMFGRRTGEGTLTVNLGSIFIRTINYTVRAGDPATIVIISGDRQSGSPGQTLAQPLVAELRDSTGNVLEGAPVFWEWGVTDPAGAKLGAPSQVSDAAGRVSATVTLGSRPGDVIVRVRSSTVASVVASFTLRAILPVAGLVKISGDNQTAITGQAFAAPLVVEVRDAQVRPLAYVTITFAVTSGSATLGATTALTGSDGRASVTVTAGGTAGAITVSASADSQSVVFSLTSRLPGPVLTASSFVNGASYKPGLVPGSVTAIVGAGLAPSIQGCVGPGTVVGPLPTKVANVEVLFGGNLAPIYAVCNVGGQEQVIVQAPWEMAPGFTVTVKVSVGAGSTVVDRVPVLAALPGIFETTAADGRRFAVAVGPDGGLIGPAKRAKKGDIVRFYGTGLGTVIPLAATNQPGFPGQQTWYTVIAGIGGKGVRVVSAGLAPMIGVYEIAIEIPADAPAGDDVALDLAVQTAEGSPPVYAATSKVSIQ